MNKDLPTPDGCSKDSTRDGCNRDPTQSLSESRVQPRKKCGYGTHQNTFGDSGMGSVTILSYWPAVDAAFHTSNGLWPRMTSEYRENWKPENLKTWASIWNHHLPQILIACPKGKPHSPSREHSTKANPTVELSQERQSWSTVLWGGLGRFMFPTNRPQRRSHTVKHGIRHFHIPNSSVQKCWGPQRLTQGMCTHCTPAAKTQGHNGISQYNSMAAAESVHLGFLEGNKSLKHQQ